MRPFWWRVCTAVGLAALQFAFSPPGSSAAATRSPLPPGSTQTRLQGGRQPVAGPSFRGVGGPLDSTNAVGPKRFIEMTNFKLGIFKKDGTALYTGASLGVDPQMVWDSATRRFYFSTIDEPGIRWGFSTTDAPRSAADFCIYTNTFDFGGPNNTYADYPRLGMTKDFLLIGINRLRAHSYVAYGKRSDLAWIAKPPPGTTCPAASSFASGIFDKLINPDGSEAFTPVPARQTDPDPTGWVVASHLFVGDSLTVFKVTKDPSADRPLLGRGKALAVPHYTLPDVAPQAGASAPPIETLDDRLSQAWSAVDPRLGHIDLWTAHTIKGGAGAKVRWYEINPLGPSLDQKGSVKDSKLFVFNGTIAPDRAVDGGLSRFGSDAVVDVDTSSTSTHIGVRMVSKVGANLQSPLVLVQASPGPYGDSNCLANVRHACYWGDFSGASPDPMPASARPGGGGQVWATNQWAAGPFEVGTWDWAASP
jgi:hypothetical protein